MTPLDWGIVVLYVLSALFIGALFTRKASKSTDDFFVAGRSLPWWIAGTSIVATTFSADTPLFVAGLSRETGIHGNWLWWAAGIGHIASVFFFAKLWRRTKVVTDIEFVVKRYDPSPQRSMLRVFKVGYDAVFVNCVIMASTTLAMAKIMKVMLHLSNEPIFALPLFGDVNATVLLLVVLGASALGYSTLSALTTLCRHSFWGCNKNGDPDARHCRNYGYLNNDALLSLSICQLLSILCLGAPIKS